MIGTLLSRTEFAADRRNRQDRAIADLTPVAERALANYGQDNWWAPLITATHTLFNDILVEDSGGEVTRAVRAWGDLARDLDATLPKTGEPGPYTPTLLATWLSTAAINAAAVAAADAETHAVLMEWVTMHDADVRTAHAATDGQQRPPGEKFDVTGVAMAYPGDPTAPIELWINCRCVLRPTMLGEESHAFRKDEPMTDTMEKVSPDQLLGAPMAWHGVIAPEGVWSGDGRMFAPDSLRFRELPLPLTWQRASGEGHDGSVVVGKIEAIDRFDGMMQASGTFMATAEADEVVGLLVEFGRFGVSVDADDAEFDFSETDGKITFTSARIASASIVAIPAFAEAFIALGTWADDSGDASALDPCDENSSAYDPVACQQQQNAPDTGMAEVDGIAFNVSVTPVEVFVSDKPWSDFTQADYTDDQWYAACCLHRNGSSRAKSDNGLPIKEPGGALNRNGVHAAAGRFGQTQGPAAAKAAAKACIRGAYKQLGEEPPDSLKATAEDEEFGRGPGWITNPVPTKRIHDYWTVPGNEGYAKIGWGTPGDFNRCRTEIGQEIAEQDPATVAKYMNQICAQWHHDATGFWPGHAPAERASVEGDVVAPALSLVASVTGPLPPVAWFTDPHLAALTPLSITEDGQVFGHLCGWETCHTGYPETCVAPPHSASGYAYFLTGEVLTDGGPVAVGQITAGGGHAPGGMRMRPALAHYDSTSAAVADVACGEDEHGIWLAGYLRPGVSEEQVAAVRASSLSGDWRRVGVGEDMELIAALAVNSPGFPVPRVGVAAGIQVSLVAAGSPQFVTAATGEFNWEAITDQVLATLAARREKMAALVARVGGDDGL